jgi:hydroxypyruvate isomerase
MQQDATRKDTVAVLVKKLTFTHVSKTEKAGIRIKIAPINSIGIPGHCLNCSD